MSSIIDDIIFGRTAANKCPNCGKGDDTKLPIKYVVKMVYAMLNIALLIVRLLINQNMKRIVGNAL